MKKIPVVSIIGRPNVGKSTLFNRLVGKRQAVTSELPGTTRDRVAEKVEWEDKAFILIDTAGFLTDYYGISEREIELKAQDQIEETLAGSNLILFVVDARERISAQDKLVAQKLRKYANKTVLVFNKADNVGLEGLLSTSGDLGFRKKIAVSATSGRRSGDLLDLIANKLPSFEVEKKALTKVAIIGRPNVGKSTLFNALIGFERAIVSDIPGTTRDSIKYEVILGDRSRSFEFIDTAGFRRRGKIAPGIEKYSVLRSVESIVSSDVVLLVADAPEGLTRGEAHLAQMAIQNNKKIILVFNKIDLLKEKNVDEIPNLSRFSFLSKIPAIAVSAQFKQNISWKEMLNRLMQTMGIKKRVITLPNIVTKIGVLYPLINHTFQGREGGLNLIKFVDLQTKNTYFDPYVAQKELDFKADDLDEAFSETTKACGVK